VLSQSLSVGALEVGVQRGRAPVTAEASIHATYLEDHPPQPTTQVIEHRPLVTAHLLLQPLQEVEGYNTQIAPATPPHPARGA
jgi:hypothetical protein